MYTKTIEKIFIFLEEKLQNNNELIILAQCISFYFIYSEQVITFKFSRHQKCHLFYDFKV